MKTEKSHAPIFLDLAKAFDTVNHEILLKKVKNYDIGGLPLNWFRPYLSGRFQYVKINNAKSDNKAVVCVVSQGSNLNLLLFFHT